MVKNAPLEKDWRKHYVPCPQHPQASLRRDLVPVMKSGKPSQEIIAVCAVCGKRVEKKAALNGR